MNFDDVIKSRKTIRKYKKLDVSDKDIASIIESAMLAPSAKNRQPWRFYVLDSKQKNDIVTMMYEWDKNNKDFGSSIKGSANQMAQASKAIVIYSPIYHNKNKKIYYKKPDYLSLGAAIENMALKCFDLGLGSSWLCDTLYIEEEMNEYLKINDFEQISTLIIGHPEEIPERPKRFSMEEIILNKNFSKPKRLTRRKLLNFLLVSLYRFNSFINLSFSSSNLSA